MCIPLKVICDYLTVERIIELNNGQDNNSHIGVSFKTQNVRHQWTNHTVSYSQGNKNYFINKVNV